MRVTRRAVLTTLVALSVPLVVTGCGAGASDRPVVVVSTTILGDVVSTILGDQAEVMTLMPPGGNPHSFEISAQEAARLRGADLLVSSGLGLEEGVQQHLDAATADGVATFVAGDHVQALPYVADSAGDSADCVDDPCDEVASDGPAAGAPDPHWWTDPAQMERVVTALEPVLREAVPGVDPDRLAAAVADYRGRVTALDAELTVAFGAIPPDRRGLVTNHQVFGYLAQRYGFRVVGTVLPSGTALAAPSAGDLSELVDDLRAAGVRTVFADVAEPERLMTVLAQEAGVDVRVVALYTESLGPAGGEAGTYLDMMRLNGSRIRDGLI